MSLIAGSCLHAAADAQAHVVVACCLWARVGVTALLPLHAQTELSLAMDGGSGEAAGWFAHEAIEDEL